MFTSFMETLGEDRKKTSMAIDRINEHLNNNDTGSKSESPSDSMRSYLPEKRLDDRRTSMFFGRTPHQYPEGDSDLEPISLLLKCSVILSIASEVFFLSSLEVSMNDLNIFSRDCSL